MSTLKTIIKIAKGDYDVLVEQGSITKGGVVYTYDPDETLYMVDDGLSDDYVVLGGGSGVLLSKFGMKTEINDLTSRIANETSARKEKDTILSNSINSLNTTVNNKVDKVSGKGLSTNDYTTAEKNKLAGIAEKAEVNQNAFSNVVVGSTTIAADSKTDTLTLVAGSNVTLTPDTTNDKITISSTNTDTHNTSKNVVTGNANSTTNNAATNGNVYLNHIETTPSGSPSVTSSQKIEGIGGTTVSSDSSGNITIKNHDVSYATSTTDKRGHWTVTIPGITELYDGLKINVRLSTQWYGNGEYYNTLNVNGLGPQFIWWRYNERLTSHFNIYAEITLTYRSSGCGPWTVNSSTGEIAKGTVVTSGWVCDYAYYSQNLEDLRYYYSNPYTSEAVYYNHLAAFDKNGKLLSITTKGGTYNASSNVFVPTATAFRPEDILITISTYAAGVLVGDGQLYTQRAYNYTNYNFNTNTTTPSTIYLVGTLDRTTGLFTLEQSSTGYYKFVPCDSTTITLSDYFTTGKYYIKVGVSYRNYGNFTLFAKNDLYYFDGSNLVPVIALADRAKTADTATALNTGTVGALDQPVYFSDGVPVALGYTISKSVPSDAVFTDTVYTHPNYTSASTAAVKVGRDNTGHVIIGSALTKSDVGLGNVNNTADSDKSVKSATTATYLGSSTVGAINQPIYLDDGTPSQIAYTINSNVPENAVFTDTHYSSKSVVTGSANATADADVATNGKVRLNHVENGSVTSSHIIKGTGATTVTSDASGTITINSTDTNTDTKVTAVGNHYTPSKSKTTSASGGTLTDITNSSSGTNVVTGVEMDAAGHVTGVTSVALKSTNTNTTYSVVSTSANGLAPKVTDTSKFLKGDGTWATPANTTYSAGTGISLSGTTFSNSGVRSVSQGSNGFVNVNTNGTTNTVAVYSLPTATASQLGGVVSQTTGTTANRDYKVEVESGGKMKVNVPWTDTNTTYSTGTASTSGLTKLYTSTGTNTDGTMTQSAINTALSGKANSSHTHDDRYYTETEVNTKLSGKVDNTSDGVSTALNKLTEGTATPSDADYYISQYAGGGTTTTTYHRRPLSALWNWIKSKLATVATSGSYTDLTNKPTSLKNPSVLAIGTADTPIITYDGSEVKGLTIQGGGSTTVTGDATANSITISSTGADYTAGTGISISNATISNSGVTGVKGAADSVYKTGNVNLTPANIGAASSSHIHSNASTTAAGFMSAADKTNLNNLTGFIAYDDINIAADGEVGTTVCDKIRDMVYAGIGCAVVVGYNSSAEEYSTKYPASISINSWTSDTEYALNITIYFSASCTYRVIRRGASGAYVASIYQYNFFNTSTPTKGGAVNMTNGGVWTAVNAPVTLSSTTAVTQMLYSTSSHRILHTATTSIAQTYTLPASPVANETFVFYKLFTASTLTIKSTSTNMYNIKTGSTTKVSSISYTASSSPSRCKITCIYNNSVWYIIPENLND